MSGFFEYPLSDPRSDLQVKNEEQRNIYSIREEYSLKLVAGTTMEYNYYGLIFTLIMIASSIARAEVLHVCDDEALGTHRRAARGCSGRFHRH